MSIRPLAALCIALFGLAPVSAGAQQAGASDRFVALDARGQPTSPRGGARPHPCVRDTATGLVWQVHTDDGGPADQDWTFTWFASRPDAFVSNVGYRNGGRCAANTRCDTEGQVAAINRRGLCGFGDWRLPDADELQALLRPDAAGAKIDARFFPNTRAGFYWSSSYVPIETGGALLVSFESGQVLLGNSASAVHVRLVRGVGKR